MRIDFTCYIHSHIISHNLLKVRQTYWGISSVGSHSMM